MGVPPVKKWAAPISFFLTTAQSGFANQKNRPFGFSAASIFCVVGFVRWGYFWGDNNFWGWCYVIGLEFVCAYARKVIFS